MGFFSRFFHLRKEGKPLPEDWTSLPADSQASELLLLDDDAQRAMAEFDIDAAISSHEIWLHWLSQALRGVREDNLRPEVIRDDTCSELGQWLHGPGRSVLGEFAAFEMLLQRHRYFHQQAALMVLHLDGGDASAALQAFKSCQHASRQVVLLLRELQRSLNRQRTRRQAQHTSQPPSI